jgi:hypothetical protein
MMMLSRCPLLPLPRSTARSWITPQQCQLPTSSSRHTPLLLALLLALLALPPRHGPAP